VIEQTVSDEQVAPDTLVNLDTHLTDRALSPRTVGLVLLLAVVLIADGFDIVLLAYLAPSIIAEFGFSTVGIGLFLSLAHVGVALGGIAGGLAGDRFGRRPVLIGSILGFGGFTLLCAYAEGQVAFMAARIGASLFMGAASPNIATYLVDVLPAKWNSRLSIVAYTAYAVGSTICGLVARALLPVADWRVMFLIGGVAPLILLPLALAFLPESPRFLFKSGRSSARIANSLNKLVGGRRYASGMTFTVSEEPAGYEGKRHLGELFTDHRGAVIGFSLLAFLLYLTSIGMTSMGTTILTAAGLSIPAAVSALLYHNIAGLVGAFVAIFLISKLGSRGLLTFVLSISLLAILTLAAVVLIGPPSPGVIIMAFAIAGFGLASSLMMLFPVAAQAFPAQVRSSGTGLVTSIGRVGSIVCSTMIAFLLDTSGVAATFLVIAALVGITISVVWSIRRHIAAS
jgi:AAHS family 4-hydroxybenzoate transporter-like MFS transporter